MKKKIVILFITYHLSPITYSLLLPLSDSGFVVFCAVLICGKNLNYNPFEPRVSDPMKQGIHPKYVETKITCGCGNSFVTRSTRPEMKVDICSNCHPFYTGKLKYVDTAGRIEKFKTKFAGTEYGKKK